MIYCMTMGHCAVQRQKAVSAYFTSKQILPFAFVRQHLPGVRVGSDSVYPAVADC